MLFLPALTGCNIQNEMLYYPGSSIPSQNVLDAEGMQFWPSGGSDSYRGFIATAAIKNTKATIVVFHGNAGTASDRGYYVQALASLGYRVILAEYPGYGGRKGKPGETALVKDAKDTVRLVSEQYGNPLFLLGESLGCAVAAAAVKDSRVAINGIILITPWDTLLSVAKGHYPWLPVGLFLTDRYDSTQNLKAFQGRIAIIGAEHDEIIPIRHAYALFESVSGSKKMWTIRGARHNDWLYGVSTLWWKEIMDFIGGS